jgi:hypothetical protein
MSRSSRRKHSPVSTPSGAATSGLRASARRLVVNDTRPEQSGQLRPRVELARHTARETGPTPSGDGSSAGRAARQTASLVFLPRARHPRFGQARDMPTRRCGHTLQWRPRAREAERVVACNLTFTPSIEKPQGRFPLQTGKKRRRGRTNQYGPTIDRRLRSPDEPHESDRNGRAPSSEELSAGRWRSSPPTRSAQPLDPQSKGMFGTVGPRLAGRRRPAGHRARRNPPGRHLTNPRSGSGPACRTARSAGSNPPRGRRTPRAERAG